jgi:hypothetical protein
LRQPGDDRNMSLTSLKPRWSKPARGAFLAADELEMVVVPAQYGRRSRSDHARRFRGYISKSHVIGVGKDAFTTPPTVSGTSTLVVLQLTSRPGVDDARPVSDPPRSRTACACRPA